jgi:hypothetical protein
MASRLFYYMAGQRLGTSGDTSYGKALSAVKGSRHTEYTAYHDQLMREIEKRLDKLEGK